MGQLRSTVDDLVSVDADGLTEPELEDDVVELATAIDRLTALLADRAHRFTRRKAHLGRGYATATAWLADVADLDPSHARRLLADGLFLDTDAGRRWTTGDLSTARVRGLAVAHNRHPEAYERDEDMLVGFAHRHSLRDSKRLVRHWINCADTTLAEQDVDSQIERAHLHASPTFGGMVRVDGLLDQQTGETLLTALDSAMTDAARDGEDGRPASNRRAEALGEICRQWLDRDTGAVGGRRPHLAVVVDLETLETRAGRRCDTDHTGTITAETARTLACDAGITRVITCGDSQILDVGRESRTVTAAQRTALNARDRHCRFQGCERPPSWCDAHHLTHWADGGLTNLINLILLCRRHHRYAHTHPTTLINGTLMRC